MAWQRPVMMNFISEKPSIVFIVLHCKEVRDTKIVIMKKDKVQSNGTVLSENASQLSLEQDMDAYCCLYCLPWLWTGL